MYVHNCWWPCSRAELCRFVIRGINPYFPGPWPLLSPLQSIPCHSFFASFAPRSASYRDGFARWCWFVVVSILYTAMFSCTRCTVYCAVQFYAVQQPTCVKSKMASTELLANVISRGLKIFEQKIFLTPSDVTRGSSGTLLGPWAVSEMLSWPLTPGFLWMVASLKTG